MTELRNREVAQSIFSNIFLGLACQLICALFRRIAGRQAGCAVATGFCENLLDFWLTD
jgi:hypothetical protein